MFHMKFMKRKNVKQKTSELKYYAVNTLTEKCTSTTLIPKSISWSCDSQG